MRTLQKAIYLAIAVLIFTACQISKEKLSEQIKVSEEEVSKSFNPEEMKQLRGLYKEYINKFPEDGLSVEYLFKCARINISLRDGNAAIKDFTNLINRYPESEYAPQAYYYIAFVYEDVIYDIVAAEVAYNDFIEKYPEHELANDARRSIKYLGKSPEEILTSILENQDEAITKE